MSGTLANDLNFAAHVSVIAEGGTVSASGGSEKIDVSYAGKGDNMQADFDRNKLPKISVKNADSLVILVAMNTDYVMNEKKNWKGADPVKTSAGTIAAAAKLPADAMRKKHIAAHAKLFNRCKIDLGETDKKTAALPTAQRIKNYATAKDDPDLEETLFQFGRYALMSSSKNSLPGQPPEGVRAFQWLQYSMVYLCCEVGMACFGAGFSGMERGRRNWTEYETFAGERGAASGPLLHLTAGSVAFLSAGSGRPAPGHR